MADAKSLVRAGDWHSINLPFEEWVWQAMKRRKSPFVEITFSRKIISTSLLEYRKTERSLEKVFVSDTQTEAIIEGLHYDPREKDKTAQTEQEMGIS
ncbi:hypothetical protein BGAL_0100g00210 [Botrytis galanthina]|uniref:Uncharacterized protein n=1 Tax=Botrytis galanthina TaxID=278940 RepID=A0A4S8R4U0_9HELO|nr:hypothetical protein BGAL_0100g00210 [Botrytis galanthina]